MQLHGQPARDMLQCPPMSNTVSPVAEKPQKKRWSCLAVLLLLFAAPWLLLLLAAGWLCLSAMMAPALKISPETTYITGPLTADGYVDYFKALEERTYPPEMKTDDNGFRVFTRLFGDQGDTKNGKDSEFYRLQKYEKLGLEPAIPPTLTLPKNPDKVFEDFYKTNGNERNSPRYGDTNIAKCRPWTLDEYPMFADWISEMDEPLDAIADAIHKPVFVFPMLQDPESAQSGQPSVLICMFLSDIQPCRNIARMFQARVAYRIAQGNIDGAIDDQLTMLRLGRQMSRGGTIIQYLIGIAIEGLATAIPVNGNPECPLTEQQTRRLLDGLDALPPRAKTADAYEVERYMALDLLQALIRKQITLSGLVSMTDTGTNEPTTEDILFTYCARSCNLNVTYRRMNEVYDLLQTLPAAEFEDRVRTIERGKTLPDSVWKLFTSGGRGHFLADVIISLVCPALSCVEEAVRRSQCQENMQRLTLAMLLYEKEHGKLPDENWAKQITPYLGDNAAQWFSCPTHPSPEGQTTYAMVQYSDALPEGLETILLVELVELVPLDKAVISADEILETKRTDRGRHIYLMNIARRSGTVEVLYANITKEELLPMLGLE